MIRCVRMWTGSDGHSAFEEGELVLAQGIRGRASGLPIDARELSFRIALFRVRHYEKQQACIKKNRRSP
jgi:hypothetical protein